MIKVLLIDDDRRHSELLCTYCQRFDIEVDAAFDGEQGGERLVRPLPAVGAAHQGDSTSALMHGRSDGSGDTYAFTNYLSTISPEFKSKVGTSTTVKFPTGVGAEKNDGVAAAIGQTDGAIGYVGLAYALSNELSMPLVENSAGSFPEPGVESVEAAADAVSKVGPNNEISLADLPASAKGAYPISTYTYIILPTSSKNAVALKKMVNWALTIGQQPKYTAKLLFAPIPLVVLSAAVKSLKTIQPTT